MGYMDFERDYKQWISEMKTKWIGEKVVYEGCEYEVMDVDYNGGLLINKPAEYTDTTAVKPWEVK